MPLPSRVFIRLSLIYLLAGTTIGSLILANKGIPFAPLVWMLLPAHMEFVLTGWMTQLALGVAYWILPRLQGNSPRGNERLVWTALILLNAGIWLPVLSPYLTAGPWSLAGKVLQGTAVLLFIAAVWRRIYYPLKFN